MADAHGVRAPLQARSRRTLDNIARATEELLEARPFDEIGVADIVRRAGCSTSSFYARFPTKEALLPFLYARYDADLRPRIAARLAEVDWGGLTLRQTVELIVGGMVGMYREREHLLRAVALFARASPGAIGDDVRRERAGVHDALAGRLARFGAEIAHPDPLDAARVGLFIVGAAARDKVLFGEAPHAAATPLTDARLARELARALHAYLTCG